MDGLTALHKDDLPTLKQLYEKVQPLHAVTTVAIAHFIERFTKKPEWTEIVSFWSLNDQWKETGTFAMINAKDDHILFNTLESWPYETLRKTLELISYDRPMVFICFRDIFRPVVLDVIRVQNLMITFDSGTRCVYREFPDAFPAIDPPDGFYFDSLNQSHVELMNSLWPQKYSRSKEYLSNCIAQNPSTGLFEKGTNELVGWAIGLETGAAGNLLIREKYRNKGLGAYMTIMHGSKTGKHAVGHIVHQNKASFHLFTSNDGQWIDNNSWIGVRPKEVSKVVPLWGHL